jgi:hypothetical protein
MPEPIPQIVNIRVEDGEVIITPRVRDIYLGEEVEWVCAEEDWEVVFNDGGDDSDTPTPFVSRTFGPGLALPNRASAPGAQPRTAQTRTRLSPDELPGYLTGTMRRGAGDGRDFSYEARVRGLNSRTASVRIFRRVRPS